MRQYTPSYKIPYLTLISEFVSDFRNLHSQLDIFDRFGKDCLTDITDIPRIESMAISKSWPESAEEKTYQFKESEKRWGIVDVIFYEGKLINICAQIFFQGLFAKSKSFKFNTLKLRPFMNEIFGMENVYYDFSDDSCSCHNDLGLKITFRYVPKTTSIATTITEEAYA